MPEDNLYKPTDETALPDIYRVKSQYLDSYYNYIDNSITYELNRDGNALRRCKGAIKSLYKKLFWELTKDQREALEKLDLNKYTNLEKAFYILSKRLKELKITDLKITPGFSSSFR